MVNEKQIVFVGAGSMAESIIAGLIADKIVSPEQITATNRQDTDRLNHLKATYGIHVTTTKEDAINGKDIVVLAMKPKNVVEGVRDIKKFTNKEQLFISVLAGTPTDYISELLGHHSPVIRTMPNTSAKVGASATAISAGKYASTDHVSLTEELFQAIGTVTVVPEEKLDAVTGLAGSGPAYIYYLVEAMEQAGEDIGLEKEEAKELIVQTILGAAKRLQSTSKTSTELYEEVMSPGGTTEAGLKVLSEYKFQEATTNAIKRATERSRELGRILTDTTTK
ncbi:pyrroline-5-carboxylate reductase [Bacillus sp. FJAT-45350]|uniref:pyrroline-5-carboxylate reductase n=1 Tax=Bacillus sp. FJAT-45350 TaxID=2011014 RepID=UPI000BB75C83|nr:pyrroline-5-carboxylate reductase [Bacillus sp. FJAT-45350]